MRIFSDSRPGTWSTRIAITCLQSSCVGSWKPAHFKQKWRWDRSCDIDLGPKGAPVCYVKYLLQRERRLSLNLTRIYAHYVRERPALAAPAVTVTHAWQADGKEASFTVQPDPAGGSYSFPAAGKNIQNRSLTIAVPNDPPAE